MRLAQDAAFFKCRADANIGNTPGQPARCRLTIIKINFNGIYPKGRMLQIFKRNICRREANRAAALITGDHRASDRPVPAQHGGCR